MGAGSNEQAGASFQRLILEKNGLQMQQQPQAAAEAGLAAPDPRATDQGGGSAVGSSGSGSAGDSDEQVQAAPAAEERQAALAAEELQALQEGPSFAEDGEEGAGEQAWDEQQQRSGTAAAEQQVQGGEGGGEEAQAEVGQQGADEELEIWDSSIEEEQQQDSAQGSRHHRAPDQRQLRCAVVNNRPWHLDVAAGLAYAFQAAGCNVTLYLPTKNIFGIKEVMEGWFLGAHYPAGNVLDDAYQYDVFALATFPEAHTTVLDALMHAALPRRNTARRLAQRFVAVVHNADFLLRRRKPARWARFVAMQRVHRDVWQRRDRWPKPQLRRLQLLTLAPSTSTYLTALLEQWALSSRGPAGTVTVPWIAPLAPWLPSFAPGAGFGRAEGSTGAAPDVSTLSDRLFSGSHTHRHLCIQGILDPQRRDYAAAFEAVSHPAVLAQLARRDESLLLLGHVSSQRALAIPRHLAGVARNISGLPYRDYYDTLSRCRAILPAFASEIYLVSKTSSTIATAINVGTPLVADSRVRGAYSFLSRQAVVAYQPPSGAPSPDIAETARLDSQQYLWMDADVMLGGGGPFSSDEHWSKEEEEEEEQEGPSEEQEEAGVPEEEEGGEQHAGSGGLGGGIEVGHDAGAATLRRARRLAGYLASTAGQELSGSSGDGSNAQEEEEEEEEEEVVGEGEELPEEGSYAAALLRLFERGASSAAHAATRRLKARLMQHNRQVAARILQEAVQLAAELAEGEPEGWTAEPEEEAGGVAGAAAAVSFPAAQAGAATQ